MTGGILEPITAGIIVSMINRYVLSNLNLYSCCQEAFYSFEVETEDDNSAENATITHMPLHHH